MADLVRAAVLVAEARAGTALIMPVDGAVTGMPNRVVVQTAPGRGADLGEAMAGAVGALWESYLSETFAGTGSPVSATAGFPVARWVSVPAVSGGYRRQWAMALEALTARKRVREFPGVAVAQTRICALTARWAAVEDRERPEGFNLRAGERLSPVGHVKRWYARQKGERFASTWSVASAPFRAAVIEAAARDQDLLLAVWYLRDAVESLREAHRGRERAALGRRGGDVPGVPHSDDEVLAWLRRVEGAWCAPETWEPAGLRRDHDLAAEPDAGLCAAGARAAAELGSAARAAGIAPLTPYLAVVAQDADHMGRRLGAFPPEEDNPLGWHRRVSGAIARVGEAQAEAIHTDHLGQVVYAGGDDFLALVPASTALAAVGRVNGLFGGDEELRGLLRRRQSASSAVVFFHSSWPLRSAVDTVRGLLARAKERERPGLGVAVLNRGGERARVVLPWWDVTVFPQVAMVTHLESLAADLAGSLSGRLAAGLEADRVGLAELNRDWRVRELGRRAVRQGVPRARAARAGETLAALCGADPAERHVLDAANAVLVARFLAGVRGGGVTDAQEGAA